MSRSLVACAVTVAALLACSTAGAAAPTGFTAPGTLAAGVGVSGSVAAADGTGPYAAVAFADRSGRVWAGRVRADGSLGSPLPAAAGQRDVRDVQVAVTGRGEIVVVWAAIVSSRRGSAVRYAVAPAGRSFSGVRTLASVGSNTAATPRIAALRAGNVGVLFRDVRPPHTTGVLRYVRGFAAPGLGPSRSLGHDGVSPQIAASAGGGALLAWARGPLGRRALEVAAASGGAALPGPATSVAGSVREIALSASPDGTAWVAWTRRGSTGTTGFARRTRSADRPAVGAVRSLGAVAYRNPHVALAGAGRTLAAWNAQGPGATGSVTLAAALGTGTSLGAPTRFAAGGFSQTSPLPAWLGTTPLVLFTRQIASTSGVASEVAVADAASGDATRLGPAASSAAPGVAHVGSALVVAWAAPGGGVAVTTHP